MKTRGNKQVKLSSNGGYKRQIGDHIIKIESTICLYLFDFNS